MITTSPQTTEVNHSKVNVIVMNYEEPVLIICEATCADDNEICEPVLRLDIDITRPKTCDDDHDGFDIVYLPETEQRLFSYISRKSNNMTVTEFNIIPDHDLHGAFATCELRNQHSPDLDDTYWIRQPEYVLIFSRPFPVSEICASGISVLISGLSIFFIVLWIVTLLATVPIIIACFLVRHRRKATVTPIEEQNSFMVKLEDVTEDEVKQKESSTSQDPVHDDDSQMQNKVDHKLPDKISSRDD